MLKIGCHLSSVKGFYAMGLDALRIGANTFQYFSRNPRGGSVKALNIEDMEKFRQFSLEHHFSPILTHAPYTLNPCSADEKLRLFAKNTMADDLSRLEYIPGGFYNFHPGSHVKQGVEKGIEMIIRMLNEIIKPEQTTIILLETMSGKGSEIGKTFEELNTIIQGIHHREKIGVCFDTCHLYDGGYDIVNHLDQALAEFDQVVGLPYLYTIHLNDTKNTLGSHKDRHEKIGQGNIGIDGFKRIINHPILRDLPFYLETPNDVEGYGQEIKLLKDLYED